MWLGYLPLPPLHLEIVVYYNKDIQLGAIRLWNYNKSIIDFTKGIKDIEIILNDQIMWEGTLEGGKGQTDVDYSTSVVLKDSLTLPQNFITKKPDVIEEIIDETMYEEEETKDEIKPE